jgi:hypothetical protein
MEQSAPAGRSIVKRGTRENPHCHQTTRTLSISEYRKIQFISGSVEFVLVVLRRSGCQLCHADPCKFLSDPWPSYAHLVFDTMSENVEAKWYIT